ncbi:MAG: VOC family protein [Bryobacteraceae bacterium]|nr:VOC family protein [Bryobacteraceae bacterium]
MPSLSDLKETALYVDDVDVAVRFYCDVLGLAVLIQDQRFCALDVNGRHVLLLFLRGASCETTTLPGGTIPPHDGSGPIHAGFAIEDADFPAWESLLAKNGVAVLSHVNWPRGGRSLYFRDPDGHLLELLTPGVWVTY